MKPQPQFIPMKKISSRTALAGTVGIDTSELSEYRYHAGRTPVAVYAIGDSYFACGKSAPKFSGALAELVWEKHPDQFWAERAGTIVWRAASASFKG